MTIRRELVDELLKGYDNPEDILGEGSLYLFGQHGERSGVQPGTEGSKNWIPSILASANCGEPIGAE